MPSTAGIRAGRAFIMIEAMDKTGLILQRISRRFKSWGRNLTQMGTRMFAGALGTSIAAAIPTKMFADFEHQMALISTMLDEPQKHMDAFRAGIRKLSTQFGKDTGDLAKAMYDILSAQVAPTDALDLLTESTRLAVAGNADVADSVGVMITLMETYGDSLTGAADAADFLMAVVKRGRTNLQLLAPELGRVIALSREAGLSVEDMGASIALMTRATGKTDLALTALQNTAKEFLKPSEEGAKLWKDKYGTAFNSATLQAEGMVSVLQKLKSMTPEEVATIFPNIRGLRGLLPALRKLEDFGTDIQVVTNRAGEAGRAFEKMSKSPKLALDRLIQGLKDLARSLGAGIVAAIEKYFGPLEDLISKTSQWISTHKELVATLVAGIAIFGAAGMALVALGLAFQGLAAGISLVSTALTVAKLGLALLLSPVGILITSLALLGTILYGTSKKFRNFLKGMGRKLASIGSTLKETFQGIVKALKAGDLQAAWDIALQGMKVAWLKFKNFLLDTIAKAALQIARWMNWAVAPAMRAAKWAGVYKGPVGEEWIKQWERMFEEQNRKRAKLIEEETKTLRELIAAIKKPIPGTPQAYPTPGLKHPPHGIGRPAITPVLSRGPLEPLHALEKGTVEAAEAAYRGQQRPLADILKEEKEQTDLQEKIANALQNPVVLKEAKA